MRPHTDSPLSMGAHHHSEDGCSHRNQLDFVGYTHHSEDDAPACVGFYLAREALFVSSQQTERSEVCCLLTKTGQPSELYHSSKSSIIIVTL